MAKKSEKVDYSVKLVTGNGASRIVALGYATATGMEIRTSGDEVQCFMIESRKVGNQFAPDPDKIQEQVFAELGPNDIVISPSGPNYTSLYGAYGRAAAVYWIDPGKLSKLLEGDYSDCLMTEGLTKAFTDKPELFYEYKPTDNDIMKLMLMTREWTSVQAARVAMDNRQAQVLKRERDMAAFVAEDRGTWVKKIADREMRRYQATQRKVGVKLTKEQSETAKQSFVDKAEKLYAATFTPSKNKEMQKKERELLMQTWRDYFGVDVLEADVEARVADILKNLQHSKIFDGIVGEGAVRTRAMLLAMIRNPLMYETVQHLEVYANIGKLFSGQAERRGHGDRQTGKPDFKKELFVAIESMIKNNPLFQSLYFAYKGQQTCKYLPLMLITEEVFANFGGNKLAKLEKAERKMGEKAKPRGSKSDVDPHELTRDIAMRLKALADLPLIRNSTAAMKVIDELIETPDPRKLYSLFVRENGGQNLQITKKRLHSMSYRMCMNVLLAVTYYRWLALLGEPAESRLANDWKYMIWWQYLDGRPDVKPTEYDPQVAVMYFEGQFEELREANPLPPDLMIGCLKTSARLDYLIGLSEADRAIALDGVTEKDRAKYIKGLAGGTVEIDPEAEIEA